MVDNLSRGGDPGRPPQALSPARAQPGPQEAPYLGIGKIFDIHINKFKDSKYNYIYFNMIVFNFQSISTLTTCFGSFRIASAVCTECNIK